MLFKNACRHGSKPCRERSVRFSDSGQFKVAAYIDRATPNTAAATLRAIMYGTTPFSHSATTFPPCSMNSRGYRLLKGNLSGRRALSEDHFYWLESERSPALASEGVFPG